MDFLLQPPRPSRPLQKVRYVCSRRYDGGDWLSYPSRVGKPWLSPSATGVAVSPSYRIKRDRMSKTEQEDFFQTWLYFGLLSEMVGGNTQGESPDVVKTSVASPRALDQIYEAFITQEGVEIYITTVNLFEFLGQYWEPLEEDAEKRLLSRVYDCLVYASNLLVALDPDFDYAIRFSITALGENVTYLTSSVLKKYGITPVGTNHWCQNFFIEETRDLMISHGWCPSDISAIDGRFWYLQNVHYLSLLDKKPHLDHSNCSVLQCEAFQIDPAHYQLSHTKPNCSCSEVGIDEADLVKILEKDGCFPVLRITGSAEDLVLEMIPISTDIEYVAISHVWANGLGNPSRCALNRCQLHRLSGLVETLRGSSLDSRPLFLWIDTLLCPVDANFKGLALAKIRNIYSQAKHVLVLDASLQSYRADQIDPVEALLRIFTSTWVRRLWTLQEGALAKSLCFQFEDVALSLDLLIKQVSTDNQDHRYKIFCADIIMQYWKLQAFFHSTAFQRPGPDLNTLDTALQHRGVSVLSDEPICIGTLMSLPLEEILAVRSNGLDSTPDDTWLQKQRMRVVWELLAKKFGGIPQRMIFTWHNYLDIPGWRWAPLTFRNYPGELKEPARRITRWNNPKLGTPTPSGLRVQYGGYIIAPRNYYDDLPHNPFDWDYGKYTVEEIGSNCVWIYSPPDNAWLQLSYNRASHSWDEEYERTGKIRSSTEQPKATIASIVRSEKAAIILDEEIASQVKYLGDNSTTSAILGTVMDNTEEDIMIRREYGTVLSRVYPAQQLIYDVTHDLAMTIRRHPLTRGRLQAESTHGKSSDEHEQARVALQALIVDSVTQCYEGRSDVRDATSVIFVSQQSTPIERLTFQVTYYFQRDYVVTKKLSKDQFWVVD